MSYDWVRNTARQIHLDFHTPPWAEGIGRDFDAKEFAGVLADAQVQVLVAFAKCHHGLSYFDTEVGKRHPGLSFDLFGAILEACRSRDIACEAYFSLNVDEEIARAHPEWHALKEDGSPITSQVLADGSELYWTWLCDNRGAYLDGFFFPHVLEFLRGHDVDGLWFDMAGYLPGTCFCKACVEGMRQEGLDPANERDHEWFNLLTIRRVYEEARQIIDAVKPGIPQLRMPAEVGAGHLFADLAAQYEIEALPSQAGPFMQPILVRYARNFGIPVAGMTARFLRNWGDLGTRRGVVQQTVEAAYSLAHGGKVIVGDHLHDDGRLVKCVYEDIGQTMEYVREREALCVGAKSVPCAALIGSVTAGKRTCRARDADLFGAAKILRECHLPFDVIDDTMPFDPFGLVIIPPFDDPVGAETADALARYVAEGGRVLALGEALSSEPLGKLAGLAFEHTSDYAGEYLVTDDENLREALGSLAVYVDGHAVIARVVDARVLAGVRHPLCVRSRARFYGHYQAPPGDSAAYPAVTVRSEGKGEVAFIAFPLLESYLNSNNFLLRKLFAAMLAILWPPATRPIEAAAPISAEVSLMRKGGHLLIHFLDWHASRSLPGVGQIAEEFPTWHNINVRVSVGERNVNAVHLVPEGDELAFERLGGDLRFCLPDLTMHEIVAIELKGEDE